MPSPLPDPDFDLDSDLDLDFDLDPRLGDLDPERSRARRERSVSSAMTRRLYLLACLALGWTSLPDATEALNVRMNSASTNGFTLPDP